MRQSLPLFASEPHAHEPSIDPRHGARSAQARSIRLGDVRLRQFGLHHGGDHGGLQRLFRGHRLRRGQLGDFGLDGSLVAVLPADHAECARLGCICRPACSEETTAGRAHRGLCVGHRGIGRNRRRRFLAGAGSDRIFQLVFWQWREHHRCIPAGTGHQQGHGANIRIQLGAWLFGWAGRAGGVSVADQCCTGRRRFSSQLCASQHVDHRRILRGWRGADLCAAARTRSSAGRRNDHRAGPRQPQADL